MSRIELVRSRLSFWIVLSTLLLTLGVPLQVGATSVSATPVPVPAKKNLCAGASGGFVPYGNGIYQWFCLGTHTLGPGKVETPSLQCGPSKADKRKKWGYWVSSPAVKLTRIQWDMSYGELNATFRNSSRTRQTFEYWASCRT